MFKKIKNWFSNNKLLLKGALGVVAGISLITHPETVPDWIIILIGVSWLFEGITDLAEGFVDKRD